MENNHYFEITLGNTFDRRFQLNGIEYGLKRTRVADAHIHRQIKNCLTVENNSDIAIFVKIEFYKIKDKQSMLTKYNYSSVLQTCQDKIEINLINWNFDEAYVCSVKVVRYEKWQNIVDSAQKMNPTKNVTSPTTEIRFDNLSSDMKRLLEQGELSDVILSDGSKEFRAHKLILSARSKVFSKMFQHSMKENLENRVTITDVPPEALKEMLTFIYTGVVTIKDIKMLWDLYVAADKYDVKELLAVCSKNLKSVDLDTVLDTLVLADNYGDQNLKQSSLDFISANYSQMKGHEKWESFLKENQALALEVTLFVLDKKA